MSLRARLLWLIAMAALLLCVLGTINVFTQRNIMLQDRQDKIRNQVESALGVVGYFEQQVASGKMQQPQAQALAAAALSAVRYDSKEYLFAYDSGMRLILSYCRCLRV